MVSLVWVCLGGVGLFWMFAELFAWDGGQTLIEYGLLGLVRLRKPLKLTDMKRPTWSLHDPLTMGQ